VEAPTQRVMPIEGKPTDFGAFICDEKARWAKVVKDSGETFE